MSIEDDDLFRKDLYGILGARLGCSDAELRSCYRKAALRLHPDKNRSLDAATANRVFGELVAAFEFLQDAGKRRRYDSALLAAAERERRLEEMGAARSRMRKELESREEELLVGRRRRREEDSVKDKIREEMERFREIIRREESKKEVEMQRRFKMPQMPEDALEFEIQVLRRLKRVGKARRAS